MNDTFTLPTTTTSIGEEVCMGASTYALLWIIFCFEFPAACMVIISALKMMKDDLLDLVYIINLLIADLIQITTKPVFLLSMAVDVNYQLLLFTDMLETTGVTSSVFFIVFALLEHHLVAVTTPCCQYQPSIRSAVLICGIGWICSLTLSVIITLEYYEPVVEAYNVLFFIPFPSLVFFSLRARKSPSNPQRASPKGRKSSKALLALVYGVLLTPFIIVQLLKWLKPELVTCLVDTVTLHMFLLSAMVDPGLYFFMRMDSCCSQWRHNDEKAHADPQTRRKCSGMKLSIRLARCCNKRKNIDVVVI